MGLFTKSKPKEEEKINGLTHEDVSLEQPADQKENISRHTRLLLDKYVHQLQDLYGSYLKNVILFGSYARGDFTEDSDVDVMILLDLDDHGLESYDKPVCKITYHFNMDNNIDIQIITQNYSFFNKWKNAHPFYKNIVQDGVMLYEAA